jgi:hypothetical protein
MILAMRIGQKRSDACVNCRSSGQQPFSLLKGKVKGQKMHKSRLKERVQKLEQQVGELQQENELLYGRR